MYVGLIEFHIEQSEIFHNSLQYFIFIYHSTYEVILVFEYDLYTQRCIDIDIENHKAYADLIDVLQQHSKYIVLVQIERPFDKNDKHIKMASQSMNLIDEGIVTRYFSTIGGESAKYVFEKKDMNTEFFEYLKSYNTFFDKYKLPSKKDEFYRPHLKRNFGLDDIGFLDVNKRVLFYTVTHEYMSCIDEKLYMRYFN